MIPVLTARKQPIPKHYFPPPVPAGGGEWLDSFHELSTDRQITDHGPGPIPAASIARHTAGWPEDEVEAFRTCIRAMDAAFLDAIVPAKDGEEKHGLPQPPDAPTDKDRRRAAFRKLGKKPNGS
ncbi:phage tail assembly chaperone [Neotabrizicola sp. VNH66]|uniref:phage tail assembly chaperone n=1 Tax=Neotabrizicola sp. VNH66 TaxID=3400918 RepID=UPI003C044F47